MKLVLTETSWILDDLNPIEWRFLSDLPKTAAGKEFPDNCLGRLHPDPLGGTGADSPGETDFVEDWKEYVEPDLDRLFSEARDRVATDLRKADLGSANPMPVRLEVPDENSEVWYSVINQARLLMNEAYGLADAVERFGGEDLDDPDADVSEILRLAQYEFYTAIQSILIEHRMRP